MRGRTSIAARIVALLLLLVAGWAGAQEPARAVPAPAPIILGSEGPGIPLTGRARFYIDTTHKATPDALEAAGDAIPWRLREAGTSYRIDGAALWFQFDALTPAGARWFAEVGSSGVDRVQFFWRGPNGAWVMQEAGDTRPVSEWPLPGRLPTFELSGRTDKPVRYWLRIEHERVDFASPLGLYDQSVLFASREAEQFLLGGYFSLAVLIALVSIGNAVFYRDRNFGVYAVYVIALAAGQLAYLGVGAQHLWDHALKWNEMASFVLPGVSAAAALWFTRTVTEPRRYSRALDLMVWAVIAALLSAVALDVVLASRLSLFVVVLLASIALVIVAVLIGVVWVQGDDPYVQLIALGFLPVLVMAVFPILRGFNLIPISPWTRYGVSIGAALEMPILFYALSVRANRRREATVRAAGLTRNDTLTGLAHTRTFLQRLEGALQRCATLKHACGLLTVKIANYESIMAEYGRDAAERALVVAASLLRGVAADTDMAARVGDHHFALLLEGPATPQDAASRAQQLVASGLRESDALPNGLLIKFQVAAALLPDRQLDAGGSLDWLLEGVNSIRPDARKLIRPLNF
ncbi:sensor domain-containing diguanylate cyclase [Ramlibacter sp. PS4R-6]|uniref:sensor domain-containing diguanylate cyclase n=1 Tax=Ramlibacter sp. PS4R-6 TaxID=3133438 RepID=UPI0030B263BD